MDKFFLNLNNKFIIEIFSIGHFLLITLTLISISLIIKNRAKLKNISNKTKCFIRFFLCLILLLNLFLRRGSFIYYGVYNWKLHLDINFCNFTSLMFLIYGLTGSKKIYNICYYMAFVGPLISILFPSVDISPLNYSFYSFIIIHHVIFIFNYIFMFVEDIKFDKHRFINILIFLSIYFFSVYMFNIIFNSSYNMLDSLININIENISFINFILSSNILSFLFFGIGVLLLLYIGILNLKIFESKR